MIDTQCVTSSDINELIIVLSSLSDLVMIVTFFLGFIIGAIALALYK